MHYTVRLIKSVFGEKQHEKLAISKRAGVQMPSLAWKGCGHGLIGKTCQCNDIQFSRDAAIPLFECGLTREI